MKVVHVIIGLNLGGAETALYRFIKSSQARQVEHTVISLTTSGYYADKLSRLGVRVHTLGLDSAIKIPFLVLKLMFLLKKINPNVVQTWMYHSDLIGGIAAKLAGINRIFWGVRCTNIPSGNKATYLIMKLCSILSSLIPQKIICVAESARISHLEYGYAERKMTVINNGFDITKTKREYGFKRKRIYAFSGEGSFVIGCVARYHPDKGLDVFIQAARELLRINPAVHFVLAGKGCSKSNEEIITLLKDLEIQDYFTLLGQVNDVPDLLTSLDVFCLPSRTEGFPNALGEAMALSVPCVSTNAGDASYLAGGVFPIVPSENIKQLAEALYCMSKMSPKDLQEIGSKERARIGMHFSQHTVVDQYLKIYSS